MVGGDIQEDGGGAVEVHDTDPELLLHPALGVQQQSVGGRAGLCGVHLLGDETVEPAPCLLPGDQQCDPVPAVGETGRSFIDPGLLDQWVAVVAGGDGLHLRAVLCACCRDMRDDRRNLRGTHVTHCSPLQVSPPQVRSTASS